MKKEIVIVAIILLIVFYSKKSLEQVYDPTFSFAPMIDDLGFQMGINDGNESYFLKPNESKKIGKNTYTLKTNGLIYLFEIDYPDGNKDVFQYNQNGQMI